MAWQQVTLTLRAGDVERAESLLRLAGAVAVTLDDAGDDPVLEPPPGAAPLWPRVRMTALFDDGMHVQALSGLLSTALDVDVETDDIVDEDWIGGWQQSIETIDLGTSLRIVPADDASDTDPATTVRLNMGLAFGTGRHPTTRLCLEWLAAESVDGLEVLDFGSGSGVLALAALRRGARLAICVDDDDQALTATRDNARLNGMTDRVRTVSPDAVPATEFDLILANILAGTLQALAPDFARRHRAGGRLVLSGVLSAQTETVTAAFAQHYRDFEVADRDGWVRIAATRR